MSAPRAYKIPRSVLVVIHTPQLQVLLIERALHPGYWQSVTGALDRDDEPLAEAARRELLEETGIADGTLRDWGRAHDYEIYPQWRQRYAPGVTRNTEHVFSLCLPAPREVRLNPREHRAQRWLPWAQAAEACFSPSNAAAIRELARQAAADTA